MTIHEPVYASIRRSPDRCALLTSTGDWTYGELGRHADEVQCVLRDAGVGPGDVVAVTGAREPLFVATVLGILACGSAFTVLDPEYGDRRTAEIVGAVDAAAVVDLRASGFERSGPPVVTARDIRARAAGRRRPSPAHVAPDALAYVAFTSGTTGRPKGILGTHAPVSHFLQWFVDRFSLTSEDCFAATSALAHDPFLRDVFTPLWLGARLVVPTAEELADPRTLLALLHRHRVSVLHLTPARAELLATCRDRSLPSLRWALVGGDALDSDLAAALRAVAPAAKVVNVYGATETPQVAAYHVVEEAEPGRAVVPIGAGIDGFELSVRADDGRGATAGEVGEICVRSRYLAAGYLAEPRATAEAFQRDPGDPSTLLYRTGDRGFARPDGSIVFCGRLDRQVKVHGFRVELDEIERVLRDDPGVADAAVVAAEDDSPAGVRRTEIVAYVVPRERGAGEAVSLRRRLAESLPAYAVPAEIVELDVLPRTASGKVERAALAAPDVRRQPPRENLESVVLELWGEVLGEAPPAPDVNFFECGGESLAAVRLAARLEAELGSSVSALDVFDHPTPAELAHALEAKAGEKAGDSSGLWAA